MADLKPGQFSLGNYIFGSPDDDVVVLAGGYDKGTSEVRNQDADNPVDDSGLFGRDYFSPPTWAFTLGVRADDADIRDTLDTLNRNWRADAIRKTPGAYTSLSYYDNGKQRMVFGRPRRYAETPGEVADDEWQVVETDFKLLEARCYDAAQQSLQMTLLETASGGGLVLPATLPFELGRSSSTRQGIINVGGVIATPFIIEIRGPINGVLSNPTITGPGFAIDLSTTVAYDETIVIDTRAKTALKNGVSVAYSLSRRSRLNAFLSPGTSNVSFKGSDPTNTATMTLKWRSAYPL